DASEGSRRMVGADVSHVRPASPGHNADRGLRCARGHQEALPEAQAADSVADAQALRALAPLPFHRLLVFVAKSVAGVRQASGCRDQASARAEALRLTIRASSEFFRPFRGLSRDSKVHSA